MMFSKVAVQLIAFNVVSTYALSVPQNQNVALAQQLQAQDHMVLERRGLWEDLKDIGKDIKNGAKNVKYETQKAFYEEKIKQDKLDQEKVEFFETKEFKDAFDEGEKNGNWGDMEKVLKEKSDDKEGVKDVKDKIDDYFGSGIQRGIFKGATNRGKADLIESHIDAAKKGASELKEDERKLEEVKEKMKDMDDEKRKELEAKVNKYEARSKFFKSDKFQDALKKGEEDGKWEDMKNLLKEKTNNKDLADYKDDIDDLFGNGVQAAVFKNLKDEDKAEFISKTYVKETEQKLKAAKNDLDDLNNSAAGMSASMLLACGALLCQYIQI
eukprot:Pgem_evm1s1006